MAKSKSKRRDNFTISTRSVPLTKNDLELMSVTKKKYGLQPVDPAQKVMLQDFEDRRRWTPEKSRPVKLVTGARARLTEVKHLIKSAPSLHQIKTYIAFQTPLKTLICIRRKIRKQVMFAKKKAGRSGQKRPHYNEFSSISCRKARK